MRAGSNHADWDAEISGLRYRVLAGVVRAGTPVPPRVNVLEQRSRPSFPGFAFFLRNIFDVVHVGPGLCQDVMQVIANADKCETLIEEFADAGCSEKEYAEDNSVLVGMID